MAQAVTKGERKEKVHSEDRKKKKRKKVKSGLTRQSEDKMTECMLDCVYIRIYVSVSE